jgi:hypothetical protein
VAFYGGDIQSRVVEMDGICSYIGRENRFHSNQDSCMILNHDYYMQLGDYKFKKVNSDVKSILSRNKLATVMKSMPVLESSDTL